jgi:hypothetical protein
LVSGILIFIFITKAAAHQRIDAILMPVAIPRNECTRSRPNSESSVAHCDLENAMCNFKPGSLSSVSIDTPGFLDCIITSAHAPHQKTILGRSAIGQSDHVPSADNLRAIVNIQISADSVIRTHVSLFDSTTTHESIPLSKSFPYERYPPPSEPLHATSIDDSRLPQSWPCSDSPLSAPAIEETADEHEAAAIQKILYSIDPTVYSNSCEPLAHWIADHVWKVTTQGLSLPLAFVDSS